VRLGLLGAGGIGRLVGDAALAGRLAGVEIVAVAGSTERSASASELAERLRARVVPPQALASSACDWVLEAAGAAAVRAHLPGLWRAGVSTVVMSLGVLIEDELERAWREARSRGVRVVLPSGGIAGLDGVRAMAVTGGLARARITTTKAPASLRGAPYLERHGIALPEERAVTVFEGSAREAVAGFPANANVAIALSLAGIGPDRTEVVMRSDPSVTRTEQRIEAEGDAARLDVRVATSMSPSNPRTSYLAGASAVAALKDIVDGRSDHGT
jgi:aspartate dehydrogenase